MSFELDAHILYIHILIEFKKFYVVKLIYLGVKFFHLLTLFDNNGL